MTLTNLLEFFALLYLAEITFYAYAAFRSRRSCGKAVARLELPKVSVVVAAKDEELHLRTCLESIVKLEYPEELIDIIVVNDQSKDSTPAIVDEIARSNPSVRRVDAVDKAGMRGKANALAQGIDVANGEFVFLTDADCTVPPTWITGTLKYFRDEIGIVGGVTLISDVSRPVYGVQALDWDFLLTIGAGAATIRKPVACLGNNLVFRKKAYEEVGGYRKIKFSVTEDYALFKAIANSGKWSYCYPMDKLTLVQTLPVETLGEVFQQRKRWATGGKDTGLFGVLTLAPGFFFHWLLVLSLFFSPGMFVLFILLKLILESLFLIPTLRLYGRITHLNFIFNFEIYYLIYVAVLPFSVYFGKAITWKGRNY